MTLTLLCSGQGNQHARMFALTADAPAAEPVFAAAAAALDGHDPRELVRETSGLHGNRTGQILCCTQALAAYAALRDRLPARLILAGYSVGELAAWGVAGLADPPALISLAVARAEAMDAAGGEDEGLAFVRGLHRDAIESLCGVHGCAVAIINPGEMFVIGGRREDLDALCRAAEARGAARSGALAVAVASHTQRLAAAVPRFREALRGIAATRVDPRLRLLRGIDAGSVRQVEAGLDGLAAQVARAIDWQGCLQAAAEAGMSAALELGPGHALAAMVAGAYPSVNARSLDDFRTLDGVVAWLAALG